MRSTSLESPVSRSAALMLSTSSCVSAALFIVLDEYSRRGTVDAESDRAYRKSTIRILSRTVERISKSGEQPEYAKARSEPRDSTQRYSERRARIRQSNRAAQPILR